MEVCLAGDSDRPVWVFLGGRGRGSIIWMALHIGFFHLAGCSCRVLRVTSVQRGSGMSTASSTWRSTRLPEVFKGSSTSTADVNSNLEVLCGPSGSGKSKFPFACRSEGEVARTGSTLSSTAEDERIKQVRHNWTLSSQCHLITGVYLWN